MSKFIAFCIFIVFSQTISAQDEYTIPKKEEKSEEESQDRSSKDSIKIKNKTEEKAEDSKTAESVSSFKRNLRLGGGLNLSSYYQNQINTQLAVLGISPQITWILSEIFEGGLATSYNYLGSFGNVNFHSFSFGPIMRAYPIDGYFIQLEGVAFYNTASIKNLGIYNGSTTSTNFNVYIGAGWKADISENSYILSGIKVNLMKNDLTYNQIFPVPFTSIHFGLWK